ncbi:toll/interleukin-1 receptor domain-containing protein [Candidatus Pacearchaeota archaeon]|nr:toll/interleukin-1 receptor domain-containing protein [Candidatus Pacearchaeota archaeon]
MAEEKMNTISDDDIMVKIFISCAGEDIKIGEKLEKDLKNQRVSPWIYTVGLKPGQIWLKEIDDTLSEADYVLGIITDNYHTSIGGVEAYANITDGLQKRDIRFFPLFFIDPENVKSQIIKSIQGFNFSKDYNEGLRKLIEFLKTNEPESAKILLSKIESPKSHNPFRMVRAEFFRDDYELLAKAFATPEKEKYDLFLENKPIFIIGGRGCGKTMLLKSLTPRVLLSRMNINTYKEAREKGVNFFGIYFRLEKGSLLIYDYNSLIEMGFSQTGLPKDYELYQNLLRKLNRIKELSSKEIMNEPIITAGINAGWAISLNEFNFKILRTVLQELNELRNVSTPIIVIDENIERKITEEICEILDIEDLNLRNFQELIKFLNKDLSKISRYIQNISTPHAKPEVNWCRTDIKFLDDSIKIIKDNVNDLKGSIFYLLFDEFENFRPFQQSMIIEWVKTSTFFVPKIASKFEGIYTKLTLQGQSLQFGEDCPHPIELDYDLSDNYQKEEYQKLLKVICNKLLEIEGYDNKDITTLLEEPKELEISQEDIDKEIKNIRESSGLKYESKKIKDYRNKLQIAAIFRLLRERKKVKGRKSRKKTYAGFETYTYLSSGIVRIFLNLVGMSLYKAEGESRNIKGGESISIADQTWASYVISRAWLEKIPDNYDFREHGEKIYQFIVDIGYLLEERLLNHPTEPECLSFTLTDPINLNSKENVILSDILSYTERESILYKRKETTAYKPKQSAETKAREYLLNRIYAPILGLSYRTRWGRNKFTTTEIMGLLVESKRKETMRQLKDRIKKEEMDKESKLSDYRWENEKKNN